MTPSARITQTESEGIIEVVQHEDFDEAMDALLNAELVDNAGWDLLITLAKEMGDRDAVKEFRKAFRAEMQHLLYIRRNVIRTSKEKLQEQLLEAA
jgi:ferritin-like metal-binding protein YciE